MNKPICILDYLNINDVTNHIVRLNANFKSYEQKYLNVY